MTLRREPPTASQIAATPALPHALAHGDNRHRRPLWDALRAGSTVLEVDVWVLSGQVFVGHAVPHPLRTLGRTYLLPLAGLVAENGCVYGGFTGPVTLLLDVKNKTKRSRTTIERELARHPQLIGHWRDGRFVPGAVVVIVTGTLMGDAYDAPLRWSGADGRLRSVAADAGAEVMPLRSDFWPALFHWSGDGPMPEEERSRLDDLVRRAHASGQRVRFWGTPDAPGHARDEVWGVLLDAGVDHLNTDDLAGARAFLLARGFAE